MGRSVPAREGASSPMSSTIARALVLLVLAGTAVGARVRRPRPGTGARGTGTRPPHLFQRVRPRRAAGHGLRPARRPRAQLTRDVFHVVEDGTPQTITMFSGEDAPVAVGLVVDNSSSMLTRRAMVLTGVKAFADASQAEDQAFTIVFNEHVRRGPPGQRRVHQQPDASAGLGERRAGGRQDGAARRGDCRPRPSRHRRAAEARAGGAVGRRGQREPCSSEDAMLRRAERSNALIYAVSTARLDTNVGNERLLRKLAAGTGGELYHAEDRARRRGRVRRHRRARSARDTPSATCPPTARTTARIAS